MPDVRSHGRPSFDSLQTQLTTLNNTLSKMEAQLVELQREVREGGYITRSEFHLATERLVHKEGRYWLVERLVFGGAGLVLIAALAAMLYTIGWQR